MPLSRSAEKSWFKLASVSGLGLSVPVCKHLKGRPGKSCHMCNVRYVAPARHKVVGCYPTKELEALFWSLSRRLGGWNIRWASLFKLISTKFKFKRLGRKFSFVFVFWKRRKPIFHHRFAYAIHKTRHSWWSYNLDSLHLHVCLWLQAICQHANINILLIQSWVRSCNWVGFWVTCNVSSLLQQNTWCSSNLVSVLMSSQCWISWCLLVS